MRYDLHIGNFVGGTELSRPAAIRPSEVFLDAATELFGERDLRCTAQFTYKRAEGYASAIALPGPLLPPLPRSSAQIESYKVSCRDTEERNYEISLNYLKEDNSITHTVSCNFATTLSAREIRRTRNKVVAISRALVFQE